MFDDIHVIWQGSLASSVTGLGALGVFMTRTLSDQLQDSMLSAAAGVMLAATFFSLLLPELHRGEALTGHTWRAALIVSIGILTGPAPFHTSTTACPVNTPFSAGRARIPLSSDASGYSSSPLPGTTSPKT